MEYNAVCGYKGEWAEQIVERYNCFRIVESKDLVNGSMEFIAIREGGYSRMKSDIMPIDNSVVSEKYLTYRIVIVRPSGYQHSSAFLEIAETIMYGLKSLGYTALIVENEFSENNVNIILGVHLIHEDIMDKLPKSTIIYNLEQFDSQSMLNNATFRKYKRFTVWDYSKRNIEKFKTLGFGNHIYHVPIGYVPELTRITKSSTQDIDVLFYGSINERRAQIIEELKQNGLNVVSLFGVYGEERDAAIARSKIIINIHYYNSSILELVRISYLLANRKAVLAECNEGTELEEYLKEAVALAPYDKLVETCIELAKNDKQRNWFEKNGFECFSKRTESDILREVLTKPELIKGNKQIEDRQRKSDQKSEVKNEMNIPTTDYFIDDSCDVRKKERIKFGNKVVIQKDCWLNIAYDNPHGKHMIEFGDGTNIGRLSTISAANRIVIGKNVLVGPNVFIADTSHEYSHVYIPIMAQGITTSEDVITIGDGTWIGNNAVIVGNITIGRGCVIGANSVINSNVPDFSVVEGNPAKIVKIFDFSTKEWISVYNPEQLKEALDKRDSMDTQLHGEITPIAIEEKLQSNADLNNLEDICNKILALEQNNVHFTGERVIIGQQIKEQNLSVLNDHIARYKLACRHVMGKDVLDAACGSGYGTAMLKMIGAKIVTGVDISDETIINAQQSYGNAQKDVRFITGNILDLPFNSESFDVITSFETIEHVDNPSLWIKESSRLLKKDGLFIVSTPNRRVTNPGTYAHEKVFNPFHKKEFTVTEFLGELLPFYDIIDLYGQNCAHPSEIKTINLIRKTLRNLPIDNIPPFDNYVKSELIAFKECVNFEPEYITAVLRKKSYV